MSKELSINSSDGGIQNVRTILSGMWDERTAAFADVQVNTEDRYNQDYWLEMSELWKIKLAYDNDVSVQRKSLGYHNVQKQNKKLRK